MDPLPAPLADARCALHSDRPAVFICRRCGAFGCDACRADPSAGLCRTCVERADAVLGAPVTVGEALGKAFRLPLQSWGAVLVFFAVALLPEVVWALSADWLVPGPRGFTGLIEAYAKSPDHDLAAVRQILAASTPRLVGATLAETVSFAIHLLAAGALVNTFVASVQGRAEPLRSTYALSLRRLLPLLVTNGAVRLGSYLGMLLCVLPGLAISALGMFVDPLVILSGQGPFSAIRTSYRMCLQAFGPIFVLLLITTIGGMVLGLPLGMLHGLARDIPLLQAALDVAGSTLQLIVLVPAIAASAYLYVRLEASARLTAAEQSLPAKPAWSP
ncbi:MAG TPA: B-box zinc finger protein [Myxococcales bacterium]